MWVSVGDRGMKRQGGVALQPRTLVSSRPLTSVTAEHIKKEEASLKGPKDPGTHVARTLFHVTAIRMRFTHPSSTCHTSGSPWRGNSRHKPVRAGIYAGRVTFRDGGHPAD